MIDKIEKLKQQALKDIKNAKNKDALNTIWQGYLGRKYGKLTKILRSIKDLNEGQRPKAGSAANKARTEIAAGIENRQKELQRISSKKEYKDRDITLPGKSIEFGHLHPSTQMRDTAAQIFISQGFEILEGNELVSDYYNFEALNIPAGHPARDMWDTFYIKEKGKTKNEKLLLRTHTSAMQVKVMEKKKPPLKVCVIGKCFRHEATDASHEHTLYQIEGFVIDKEISVANLIYTLKNFLNVLFDREVKVRLRPSYFPFTEPSFEMDFACLNCGGNARLPARQGCPACSQSGWVEMLGCGMIHPHVFKSAGYPRGKYTGFAFGIGLDRLVMMRHKIDDIRWLHSGDLRFIRQF